MTVFGNSAIEMILGQEAQDLAAAVQQDESVALFKFLEHFPLPEVLSVLSIVMVFVFFITSADSGAMVLNMLSSNGRDDTPLPRRVFWMAMIGISAMVLLLAGGLSALQTAAIASALPFSLAVLAAIWGFVKALSVDHAKREALTLTTVAPSGGPSSSNWKTRLHNLLNYPRKGDVEDFIGRVVVAAMQEFSGELRGHGLDVRVELQQPENRAALQVMHGDEIDFQYLVTSREHPLRGEALVGEDEPLLETHDYCRAEVHLNEGSQDYDIMGWTQDQIVHDLLEQYEKHLHFLHLLR